MSDGPENKILSFLTSALARTDKETIIKIDLVYSPTGGYRADQLKSWRREVETDAPYFEKETTGKPNLVYVQQLVTEIMEIASNHADSYGQGRHRFVIRAYKPLNGYSAHAFVLLPSFDSDDQALVGGPGGQAGAELVPTQAGLVGQLMRHLEVRDRNQRDMLQAYIGGMSSSQAQLREENDSLRAQLALKDRERVEWMDQIEQARSGDHQRQIEALTATSREERKTHAAKKFVNLLPVALSHFMGSGKKKMPGAKDGEVNGASVKPPSPLAQLVHKLFDSLDDDQRGQIAAALQMEQQILLVEISDVVENGDSVLLPTMLHDLVTSLLPPQITALMSLMTAAQRVMFVQAIKLAAAQAAPSDAPASNATDNVADDVDEPPQPNPEAS